MRRLYTLCGGDEEAIGHLSYRQRLLLNSAINYHSLTAPGQTLRYLVYCAMSGQSLTLTGRSSFDGTLVQSLQLKLSVIVEAASLVELPEYQEKFGGTPTGLRSSRDRYIVLTPDPTGVEQEVTAEPSARLGVRVYNKLGMLAPVAFDFVREGLRRLAEDGNARPITPISEPVDAETVQIEGGTKHGGSGPGRRQSQRQSAVIIGMYWLQAGGAERWGIETVRLAQQAGLLPIVITDRESQQPWITDPMLQDAVVLPLERSTQDCLAEPPLLAALFSRYDVKAVLIHHCQWLYDRVWWIKQCDPSVCVVDSLHILEYVMQGGYPREAIAHDQWIDLHHVISPQLEQWMVHTHGIAAGKVVDAPLIGLTADSQTLRFKERGSSARFVVAFIGRMARQKRPEAFILTARYLEKKRPGAFHFIMHGSGDMDGFVDRLISRYHLEQVIERRSGATPVAQTYDEADALVVSSINEGITLTTIEAISAGVPVLSANVGSQSTLVSPVGLLPRLTASFVRAAAKALVHMTDQESDRRRLWQDEAKRLMEFSKLESADDLFRKLFEQWSK